VPPNSPPPRSFSLSIGQLTFGGFAGAGGDHHHLDRQSPSAISMRRDCNGYRVSATRRGRRPPHERIAAGGADFVTDPGTQSVQVGEAAAALSVSEDATGACPEQQSMIDGVTERLRPIVAGSAHFRADQCAPNDRRAAALREIDAAIADTPDPVVARLCFRPKAGRLGAVGA
jgi:hypothetical protein